MTAARAEDSQKGREDQKIEGVGSESAIPMNFLIF
jgi:hypothetical protein